MTSREAATIAFRYQGYGIKFDLPLPDPGSPEFTLTPSGRRQRSEQDAAVAWEKACRSRWRILLLTLRAKLEAVEAGISTFEAEFLPWIVCQDGSTIGENLLPNLGTVITKRPMAMLGLPASHVLEHGK